MRAMSSSSNLRSALLLLAIVLASAARDLKQGPK
jgi:hypothetical protein